MDQFYVVRYSAQKFAPAKGSKPTSFLAEAKQYETEADALKSAAADAVGVSFYGHENGKPVPLKHMSLANSAADK